MPFVNFRKNFASFPSIFARISLFEHFRGDWAAPNFFIEIFKTFFFQIFTLVLLDGFIDGFSKFWFYIGEIFILIRDFWVIFKNYSMCMAYAETILLHAEHTRIRFHCMLNIRRMNFHACSASGKMWTFWHVQSMLSIRGTILFAHLAYRELISWHAEHARKCFLKVKYLGWIEYDFQKSRVTGLWTIRFRFLQKKYIKKFHDCVPSNWVWVQPWDCSIIRKSCPFSPTEKQCSGSVTLFGTDPDPRIRTSD